MTNSAQVSFTFFTNCTDEQYRSFGLDLLILNGLRKRDQSDRPQIVGDARCQQSFAGSNDREVVSGPNTVSRCALTTSSGDSEVPLRSPRQLPSSSISTSVRPSSENFSLRYSARCRSPNGLAGIEQIRICSSVIAFALVSKKPKACVTSRDDSKDCAVTDGEVFNAEQSPHQP